MRQCRFVQIKRGDDWVPRSCQLCGVFGSCELGLPDPLKGEESRGPETAGEKWRQALSEATCEDAILTVVGIYTERGLWITATELTKQLRRPGDTVSSELRKMCEAALLTREKGKGPRGSYGYKLGCGHADRGIVTACIERCESEGAYVQQPDGSIVDPATGHSVPARKCVKQSGVMLNCAACVAAMITGHRVEEVHKWLGNCVGEPMHDSELFAWCLKHGWMPFLTWDHGPAENPEAGATMDLEVTVLTAALTPKALKGVPCYVAVRSHRHDGLGHAILWLDGVIYDPHPDEPDEQTDMSKYQVLSVTPFAPDPMGYSVRLRTLEIVKPTDRAEAMAWAEKCAVATGPRRDA